MNAHVLDASVILIALKREPQFDLVLPLLPGARVSAVNASECLSVLVREGVSPDDAIALFATTAVTVTSFDQDLAEQTGALIAQTMAFGLSLGDRACLALALRDGLPVYTADRNWRQVKVGVEINVVR